VDQVPGLRDVLYKTDLEQNLNVCPKCSHHHRIGARLAARRLPGRRRPLRDRPGSGAVDALKFKDSKKYPSGLKEALESTGETDALVVMGGAVHSIPVVARASSSTSWAARWARSVGERFVRGVERRASRRRRSSASPPPAARACRKGC
jgi:acetyl-CoA carboxylase carboxyl transferase subunit beta